MLAQEISADPQSPRNNKKKIYFLRGSQPLCTVAAVCEFESLHRISKFCHFCPFFQTLRASSPFQRTLANKNTLPCCSTRFRELLELSLIHGLPWALCVTLVWKIAIFRSKNVSFLPFSYF